MSKPSRSRDQTSADGDDAAVASTNRDRLGDACAEDRPADPTTAKRCRAESSASSLSADDAAEVRKAVHRAAPGKPQVAVEIAEIAAKRRLSRENVLFGIEAVIANAPFTHPKDDWLRATVTHLADVPGAFRRIAASADTVASKHGCITAEYVTKLFNEQLLTSRDPSAFSTLLLIVACMQDDTRGAAQFFHKVFEPEGDETLLEELKRLSCDPKLWVDSPGSRSVVIGTTSFRLIGPREATKKLCERAIKVSDLDPPPEKLVLALKGGKTIVVFGASGKGKSTISLQLVDALHTVDDRVDSHVTLVYITPTDKVLVPRELHSGPDLDVDQRDKCTREWLEKVLDKLIPVECRHRPHDENPPLVIVIDEVGAYPRLVRSLISIFSSPDKATGGGAAAEARRQPGQNADTCADLAARYAKPMPGGGTKPPRVHLIIAGTGCDGKAAHVGSAGKFYVAHRAAPDAWETLKKHVPLQVRNFIDEGRSPLARLARRLVTSARCTAMLVAPFAANDPTNKAFDFTVLIKNMIQPPSGSKKAGAELKGPPWYARRLEDRMRVLMHAVVAQYMTLNGMADLTFKQREAAIVAAMRCQFPGHVTEATQMQELRVTYGILEDYAGVPVGHEVAAGDEELALPKDGPRYRVAPVFEAMLSIMGSNGAHEATGSGFELDVMEYTSLAACFAADLAALSRVNVAELRRNALDCDRRSKVRATAKSGFAEGVWESPLALAGFLRSLVNEESGQVLPLDHGELDVALQATALSDAARRTNNALRSAVERRKKKISNQEARGVPNAVAVAKVAQLLRDVPVDDAQPKSAHVNTAVSLEAYIAASALKHLASESRRLNVDGGTPPNSYAALNKAQAAFADAVMLLDPQDDGERWGTCVMFQMKRYEETTLTQHDVMLELYKMGCRDVRCVAHQWVQNNAASGNTLLAALSTAAEYAGFAEYMTLVVDKRSKDSTSTSSTSTSDKLQPATVCTAIDTLLARAATDKAREAAITFFQTCAEAAADAVEEALREVLGCTEFRYVVVVYGKAAVVQYRPDDCLLVQAPIAVNDESPLGRLAGFYPAILSARAALADESTVCDAAARGTVDDDTVARTGD